MYFSLSLLLVVFASKVILLGSLSFCLSVSLRFRITWRECIS